LEIYWSLKRIPELSGLSWQQRRRVFRVCRRRYGFCAPLSRSSLIAYSCVPLLYFGGLALAGPVLDLQDYRGALLILSGAIMAWFLFSRTTINRLRPFYVHYLPGNRNPEAPLRPPNPLSGPRSIGLLLMAALAILWGVGVHDAILGGLQPAMHVTYTAYATIPVLVICGIITGEAALLYGILRPLSFSSKPGRAFIALAVFILLWRLDYNLGSAWTDQPGWCYSNLFFLRAVVKFLTVASCVSLLALIVRNWSKLSQ
jgi:hypothetical protein